MLDMLCFPKYKKILSIWHIHSRTKFHEEWNHSRIILWKYNVREIKWNLNFTLITKNLTRLKSLCSKNSTSYCTTLYSTSLTTEFSENFFISLVVDCIENILSTKYFIPFSISSGVNSGKDNGFESAVFATNFGKHWSCFWRDTPHNAIFITDWNLSLLNE